VELRGEYNALQSEMENASITTKQKMDTQMTELQRMETSLKSGREEKTSVVNAIEGQIAQLKEDISATQNGAQKTVAAQNTERREMEDVIVSLKSDIAQEEKLRKEALQSKSNLEAVLAKKIDELSRDIVTVRQTADKALQEKDQQLQQMNAVIENSKVESGAEAAKNQLLTSELELVVTESNVKLTKAEREIKQREMS